MTLSHSSKSQRKSKKKSLRVNTMISEFRQVNRGKDNRIRWLILQGISRVYKIIERDILIVKRWWKMGDYIFLICTYVVF